MSTTRQLTIPVDQRVIATLTKMAAARGVSPSSYASMLFDAAYAARTGFSADAELKAKIELVLVLHGARRDSQTIAEAVGLQEHSVERILSAWRSEMSPTARARMKKGEPARTAKKDSNGAAKQGDKPCPPKSTNITTTSTPTT